MSMGFNESSAKRKTHSSECLHKAIGKIICYQLNSTSESSREKKDANTPKTSRWQEIIKH